MEWSSCVFSESEGRYDIYYTKWSPKCLIQDAPKLIIDDDWKSSAQAEKEKLVAAEQEKAEQDAKAGPGGLPEVRSDSKNS